MESMVSIKRRSSRKNMVIHHLESWMKTISMEPIILSKERQKQGDSAPWLGLETTVHHKDEWINLRFLALSNQGYQNLMKLSFLKMTGKKNGLIFFT